MTKEIISWLNNKNNPVVLDTNGIRYYPIWKDNKVIWYPVNKTL